MMDARARLGAVAAAAGLDPLGLSRIESYSNDVYFVQTNGRPAVLHICWQGRRERLLTGALVSEELPVDVGAPRVIRAGRLPEHDLTWSLSPRLSGCPLSAVWGSLNATAQDAAAQQLAERIAALHRYRPSPEAARALRGHLDEDDGVGAAINPLPVVRLRRLLASGRPPLTSTDLSAVIAWVDAHAHLDPAYDDPRQPVLHGDLQMTNVWWDGRRVSGLIDLEWARFGPAYADLARLVDNVLAERTSGIDHHADLLRRLVDCRGQNAQELEDGPLMLCVVAFLVRQTCAWPAPTGDPPPDHPVSLLRAVVQDDKLPGRLLSTR